MGKYKVILFDLDGTLTDSKEGITKSVQYALEKMNVHEPDLEKLTAFIGPPLQNSFSEYYRFDEEQTKKAISYYRERFTEVGLFENKLYDGILMLLQLLKKQNVELVVATSKPTVFAEKIINYFGIDTYFNRIVGSNLDGSRAVKSEIIQYIVEQYPSNLKEHFLMIGDRKHDLIGAREVGIDAIGVTFGYGSDEELAHYESIYIAQSIELLQHFLCRKEEM